MRGWPRIGMPGELLQATYALVGAKGNDDDDNNDDDDDDGDDDDDDDDGDGDDYDDAWTALVGRLCSSRGQRQ